MTFKAKPARNKVPRSSNSGIFYYKDGSILSHRDSDKILHRKDGPAIIFNNGDLMWYQDGLLHRSAGPAIEWVSGDSWWFIWGERFETSLPRDIIVGYLLASKLTLSQVLIENDPVLRRSIEDNYEWLREI